MTSASTLDLSAVRNPPKFCIPQNDYCTKPETGVWSGRAVTALKNGMHACATAITHVFQNSLHVVSSLFSSPGDVYGVFKKLQVYTLPLIEKLNGTPNKFEKMKTGLQHFRGCTDLVQLGADVAYVANGEYKKDRPLSVAGRISFIVTNIVGTAAWLTHLGVVNLSAAAKAIGNVRIFGLVPAVIAYVPGLRDMPKLQGIANAIGNVRVFGIIDKLSLGFVTERALGLAYMFFAADAAKRLIEPGNAFQKTQAGIDLLEKLSVVALDAMMLIGLTSVIGFGLVGTVSLGLTLTNFIYKLNHDKELKQPLPMKA